MLFHHYTSHLALRSILRDGLDRGEAPLAPDRWLKAVNLTTSRSPHGHGLDAAGFVWTKEASDKVHAATGQRIPPGTVNLNKRAVRIDVRIPMSDRRLQKWVPWARKRLDPAFFDMMVRGGGGGMASAKTWWLYWGVIPPDAFVDLVVLEPDDDAPGASGPA